MNHQAVVFLNWLMTQIQDHFLWIIIAIHLLMSGAVVLYLTRKNEARYPSKIIWK